MDTKREKVSYCIGLEAGGNIRSQFKDIDFLLLKKGFSDAIEEKNPVLEREEIREIMNALHQQIQEQQKAFVEQLAIKNKEEGENFLESNKIRTGVKVLPSGLQYMILKSGTGEAKPKIHNTVSVHYRGELINGKVFDSTYEKDAPAEFPLSRVIPGWSEALKMMVVGDKWKIFIPSYLAYGETGYGPQIEPNATLIFEMELIKIH